MELIKLALAFRSFQLYAHQAHLMTSGKTFLQDHAFFGELYGFAESSFDSLMEKAIANGEEISLHESVKLMSNAISSFDEKDFLKESKEILKELLQACESLADGQSLGTNNLIAGIADKIEGFLYKLKQLESK